MFKEKYDNLEGKKFHNLLIIKYIDNQRVLCDCDCGFQTIVRIYNLLNSTTKSCGCHNIKKITQLNKDRAIHGQSKSNEFKILDSIKQRCYNKKNKDFVRYGERGITVCDRWLEPKGQGFINFYSDMGKHPSLSHSVERIDNNKGYSPDNCKWATHKEQQRNTRTCKLTEANIKEIKYLYNVTNVTQKYLVSRYGG